MNKIVIGFLVILGLTICSCDDFVDIDPRGLAIASSLEEADLLLNDGESLALLDNSIAGLVNDNVDIPENTLIQALLSDDDMQIAFIYGLDDEYHPAPLEDANWNRLYGIIGRANMVLDILEDNEESAVAFRNRLMAEALVHRAHAYFFLVNIYGPHYGLEDAAIPESGVPILTKFSDTEVPLVRKSVVEAYDFILNDITEAIPFLEETTNSSDRPNLGAGLGLLAQVQLHMGNYTEALQNATKALSFNSTLLDYNTGLSSTGLPFGISNPEILLYKGGFPVAVTGQSNAEVFSASLYSAALVEISDTENDLRISELAQVDSQSGQFGFFTNTFQLGVTVPRLMLLQAECLARTGDFEAAVDLVNTLRASRFEAGFVNSGSHLLSAVDAAQALEHIIAERRREFNVDGTRFFDIKRLNALENMGISLTRNGKTYTPNSINWAAPLAEVVVANSDGQIKQNTRE